MSEADVLGKMELRTAYPVTVGGKLVCHCRALTIGEIERLDKLAKHKTPFVMGYAIVEPNGDQVFAAGIAQRDAWKAPETPEDGDPKTADEWFGGYMRGRLENVSTEVISAVSQAVGKIGKLPEADTLKN